jgi:uncharacterized protein (TIGR03067 family)
MGRPGTAVGLFVLLAATSSAADEPRPLPKELQGEWAAVAMEFSGQSPPADIVDKYRVVVKGDKISLSPLEMADGKFTAAGEPFELRCEHDPNANSKGIDLIFKNGDEEIRMLGIYVLEEKRLKICWQHDGKARPKEFKTGKEPSQTLLVLERKP